MFNGEGCEVFFEDEPLLNVSVNESISPYVTHIYNCVKLAFVTSSLHLACDLVQESYYVVIDTEILMNHVLD